MKKTLLPIGFILQLGSMITCSIFGTLAIGLWIDRWFSSSPWGVLIFMVFGLILAIAGVYRVVASAYERQQGG